MPSTARLATSLLAFAFAAAALSCAPVRTATRADVVRPPVAQTVPPPPVVIAPEQLPPDVSTPPDGGGAPAAPEAMPPAVAGAAPEDELPPPPATDKIALVLPLQIPAYERAAAAVRDGFLDAADVAGARARCVVIPYGVDGVITAFEAARAKGVAVAVGPLVRDDLKTLAISGAKLPWTLALNQLDDGTPLPNAVFSFALTVESDARMLAQRALASGLRSVDVIHSFYLPNLRQKVDVVPGTTTHLWFAAKQTGEFEIACAQHCGVHHYKMRGLLTVYEPERYRAWLGEAQANARAAYDGGDLLGHWGWRWDKEYY